jgi:hypothetical protein
MRNLIRFVILILFITSSFAEVEPPKEFKGAIIDSAGAMSRTTMTQFVMKIEKYTSDEDTKRYSALLTEKGEKALADSIRNLEIGSIVIGNRNSYTLSIARTFVQDGKRIVRALTDRPITMIEASKNPRGKEYPFGVIEIEFEPNGKGKGILVPAAKIQITDDALKVEGFAFDPFRLTNISAE